MKHLKIIGLLVVAAASLMAFASSASAAPVLTGPLGEEYTGEIHATIKPGTTLLLKGGSVEDTCTTGTVAGKVTVNNSTHAEGGIFIGGLTFGTTATPCTKTTHVLKPGKLTIGDKGEVIASENEVTVFDLGVTCVYGGGTGTNIGTLTGGEPAVMDINTTVLPKILGSILCGNQATWTGAFVVTTPRKLTIT